MKIVAIAQARMGSARLPQKVMMPLAGRPMVHHVVERARRIDGVDEVVLATSESPGESELVEYGECELGVPVVRGPEDDVLRRYILAATEHDAHAVMRITADCPLLSPRVSAQVLRAYIELAPHCDYASNTLRRTYPRGLDTEVISVEALRRAHRRASTSEEREHVTLHICSRPRQYRLLSVEARQPYPPYRWTVDTRPDYRLLCHIFDALYEEDPRFELEDVLELLMRNPGWLEINADVKQKSIRS